MSLNIWRFTDGRPGHDSQSIGLCLALEKQKECQRIDLPVQSVTSNIKNLLLKQSSILNYPLPDIIIGAGHKTHLSMLLAKLTYGGKVIVLMKPSLPLFFFDLCLIPKHDITAKKDNVVTTIGALNPISLNPNKSSNTGLILLGGPSKHYHWNNTSIIDQIKEIITYHREIKWTIADSGRSPTALMEAIHKLNLNNVTLLPHHETETKNIRDCIFMAENIWVSTDSISMTCESLSSGAKVGLLTLQPKKNNRLNSTIKELIERQYVTTFFSWKKSRVLAQNTNQLNESARCSQLIFARRLLD